MNGKIIGIGILTITAICAVGVYYAQVYGYYRDVPNQTITLTSIAHQKPEAILADDVRAMMRTAPPFGFAPALPRQCPQPC